jgi:hypothetical protein
MKTRYVVNPPARLFAAIIAALVLPPVLRPFLPMKALVAAHG